MGENECGSQACMLELYVIDEIEKGVFICLGLFIDDGFMLLEKLSVEVFELVHSLTFVDWVE